MVPFGGWFMPVQYTGIVDEHQAVRTAVGMFDISHMGQFVVSGNGARDWLDTMAAGIATLRELKDRPPYERLERLSRSLVAGLAEAARSAGVAHGEGHRPHLYDG